MLTYYKAKSNLIFIQRKRSDTNDSRHHHTTEYLLSSHCQFILCTYDHEIMFETVLLHKAIVRAYHTEYKA